MSALFRRGLWVLLSFGVLASWLVHVGCERTCSQCTPGLRTCTPDGKYVNICQQIAGTQCWTRAVTPCHTGTCVMSGGIGRCEVCGPPCNEGSLKCENGIVSRCEGSTGGCPKFSVLKVCPSGACDLSTNDCTAGTGDAGPPCTPNGQKQRGCVGNAIHWVDNCKTPIQKIADCPASQRCFNGQCQLPCQDTCGAEGQGQCRGTGVEKCTRGANGCLFWAKPTPCPSGICNNGKCHGETCPNACRKDGEKECKDGGYRTCSKSRDNCYQWSTVLQCPGGTRCSGGSCTVGGCNHECGAGMTQCQGNSVQSCKEDSGGCFVWGDAQACAPGQSCVNGSCEGSSTQTDIGSVCSSDADCSSIADGKCFGNNGGVCSKECPGGTCPGGAKCVTVTVQIQGGTRDVAMCFRPCQSDANCIAGSTCDASQGICVP